MRAASVTIKASHRGGGGLSGLSRLSEGVHGSREEAPLQIVRRGLLPPLFHSQDAGARTRLGQQSRQGV